jgi:hypothetical protein
MPRIEVTDNLVDVNRETPARIYLLAGVSDVAVLVG